MVQSRIFPMFVRAEYDPGNTFSRFQSDAQRSAEAVKREYRAVGQVIDQALSTQRNTAGSLDLGLDELRESVAIQQARAVASREVADASLRAASSGGKFNAQLREGVTAARQYATEQERVARELQEQLVVQEAVQRELNQTASATDRVTAAGRRGTTARGSVVNSVRSERVAFIQLGQQMQDVTVQAQLGTNAFQIFAQQAPQAAFALSGLEGSANSAKNRIGQLATFLSGPWGAAVFAATAVLGPFILSMLESEDAAEKNTDAHQTLAEQLDITRNSYEEVMEAIDAYNREAERSIKTTLQQAQASALAAQSSLDQALAAREALAAQLEFAKQDQLSGVGVGGASGAGELPTSFLNSSQAAVDANAAAIERLQGLTANTNFELATEQARIQSDASAAIAENYANLRQQLRASTDDVEVLRDGLIEINRQEQQALETVKENEKVSRNKKRGRDDSARLLREIARLNEFGADAGDRIANIRDQFADIPQEVQRINRLTRTLNDLIEDLGERKPEGFRQLIDEAEDLRDALPDLALDASINQISRSMLEQLETQRLILSGRDEEAQVLQIMRQLEERFGVAARERLGTVQDIVDARIREEEVMAGLRETQDAYLGATQDVRREIENLLSGESVDFEQVFKRLRARVQTEEIFGDIFRQFDRDIRSEYEQAVDDLAQTSVRTKDSFELVGEAAEAASVAMQGLAQGRPAGRANAFAASTGIGSGISAITAAFGSTSVAGSGNDNELVVEGTRKGVEGSNTALALTPNDYADMLSERLTQPILDRLPEEIANDLGPVLNGALSGFIKSGPIGGVLGGLEGIFGAEGPLAGKLGESISKGLAGAVGGAQTGGQVDAVFDALGIRSSGTGAQLGGAVGSLLGPIGSVVGSVVGGLLGGVLSGSKRGSATIGGSGSSLGVTGFGGNSSRREGATSLADEVIGVINRFADGVGATVNASRGSVSIGTRNDDIRVDRSGGGQTKTSRGAVDFGQDAEAAVLFAVQDLINDGVIEGLKLSERNLLQASNDIEAALSDILAFRDVFDRLDRLDNPLEAEIRALNNEFEGLIDLFERARASQEEFADLQRLYELERAELVEEATERVAGSLRDLVQDLTTGDNGLSLRARRENALGEFNSLRSRVEAGDTSAFDEFETAARDLLAIERQIFGSQQEYFDRFNQILEVSNAAIADQQRALEEAAGASSPFPDNDNPVNPIGLPIAEQTETLAGWLALINGNLGNLAIANGSAPFNTVGGGSFRSSETTLIAAF